MPTSSPLARPSERRRSPDRSDRLPMQWTRSAAAVLIIVAAALFGYGTTVGRRSGSGLLALVPLLPLCHVLIRRVAAREQRFDLIGILWLGLGAKLVATYFRLLGGVDAIVYDKEGARLAAEFRHLNFTPDVGRAIPGTGTIRYLTGLVHLFTNSSYGATFVVFSLFGFTGLVYAYRAFVVAVPDGQHKRFALLVLLWPTLLFWPSSIGKESVMILGIGLALYGAAGVLDFNRRSFGHLGAGLFVMAMVRPHVALIMLAALFAAFVLRAPDEGRSTGVAKAVGVVALLIASVVVMQQTEKLLGLESLTSEAGSSIAQVEEQTSQGGAQFSAARVRTPLDYPRAVVTVLFRPFPWEAKSGMQMLTALEGLALMALLSYSVRRAVAQVGQLRRRAYLLLVVAFAATFVYLFAAIGNFGILTRQRSQVLPLLLALAALPVVAAPMSRAQRRRRGELA